MKKTVVKESAAGYVLHAAGDDRLNLAVSGRLNIGNMVTFGEEATGMVAARRPASLTIDLAGLEYLDSAGALALLRLEGYAAANGAAVTFANVSPSAREIMDLIDFASLNAPPLHQDRPAGSLLVRIGTATFHLYEEAVAMLTFLGELITALAYSFLHFPTIRGREVLFYMKRAGADALPIVGLISLLIGLIMAFMSSLQLKQFGANIFVASLVGISIVKELAPIMTAIIVSGRSGSAFAAEIGSMLVNEEIDALVTMGFDPLRFLAVPKVLAAMIVVPLLTLYSMLFGIIGGLAVGVLGLGLTFYTYIQETIKHIETFDVVSSLIKSVVFAVLIAGVGCQRGFQVTGGAEGVGEQTTSAVVAAIFLIVVADSAFAIVFHYLW